MPRVSRKAHAIQAIQPAAIRVYKAAVYVRLSVEDMRKKISDSIGTQTTMLTSYVQFHPDLQLYKVYEDVNYTGTNFERPGFTRMMEDIQAGMADCVIVKDLSRFGRSFEEMGHYLENVFPFLQVRFISVNDNYDSLTATMDESGLIVPLKNLINEIYARDISRKVQSGYAAKQKRGEFCGSFAPYGYTKDGSALIVDEETAPIVRQIFGWIIEGMGDALIAQKLNGLKITPPSRYRFEKGITKGKKHENTKFWYKSAVKRMSENPAYTGVMASGKYQSNFLCGGGGRTTKTSDEWIITEDAHIAIVDSKTFEAVQKIRKARQDSTASNGSCDSKTVVIDNPNIFKGLIFCGDCGCHMTRRKCRDKYVFLCNVYEEVDKQACTPKPIKETNLTAALYACIRKEISIAVDMARIIADVQKQETFQNAQSALEMQIKNLQKKLEQNRRFRGSLREDYVDCILSEQDYSTMKVDYDEEKSKIQQELDRLVESKVRQENTLSPENKFIAEFKRFEKDGHLSAGMLSALVKRIDVYDDTRIEVTMRYRDEFEVLREYLDGYTTTRGVANE
jgi:DNA invertase Pin-like site-specific DNA recombinase